MQDTNFLTEWLIPIVSIIIAVIFATSAKKDSARAQDTLKSINDAMQTWQKQIMDSAINIMNSTPQVIEGKQTLAKIDAANKIIEGISESVTEIAKNPQPGSTGSTQEKTLNSMLSELHLILDSIVKK